MVFDVLFGGKIKNISVKETEDKLKNKNIEILDVRTKDEYRLRHIPQAINIPLSKLENNLDKISKDKEIIVVCASGIRSKKATKKLINLGYKAKNMEGGMKVWIAKVSKDNN